MIKELVKIRDFQKNSENPFLKQAVEKVNNNIVKKYKTASKTGEKAVLHAYDPQSGEVLGHTSFIRQIEVDEEQFTKVYLSNFSKFFDLPPQAIKVFGYIMTVLLPKKDMFYFVLDDCLNYTGYKGHKSIHDGLAFLLKAEIIARGKTEYIYFINPMVAFNGDRITFAKTYIKKQKGITNNPNQIALFSELPESEPSAIQPATDF
jgi:hypothetical protein